MNAYILATAPAAPIPNQTPSFSSTDTFLAILIPVAIAAGAYARQLFVTKETAEKAEETLINALKAQIQMQQREIYQLRNEIRILRATLDNSGSLSSQPVLRKREINE